MELMDETLTHFLEQAKASLPYHTQLDITYDIALALDYLHLNKIIHRDLSSSNVLLKRGTQAKVSDFGMLKAVGTNPRKTLYKVSQCPGTPAFMPPEALRTKPRYSDKLDVFSLGVLIVQIITRKFPAPTDAEVVMEDESAPTGEKIVLIPERERRKNDITKIPSDHALLPIALACLKDRDRERPTAVQLCERLEQIKASPPPTKRIRLEEEEVESMEISQQQIKEIVNSSLAAPTDNQGDSVKTIPEPVSYHVEILR